MFSHLLDFAPGALTQAAMKTVSAPGVGGIPLPPEILSVLALGALGAIALYAFLR